MDTTPEHLCGSFERKMKRRNVLKLITGLGAYEFLQGMLPEKQVTCAQEVKKMQGTIIVLLAGAMSSLDSWDYKPHAATEVRGPFSPIKTKTGDAIYSHLFPSLATMNDRYALLRAMEATTAGSHFDGYKYWLNAAKGHHLPVALSKQGKGIPYVDVVVPGVLNTFAPERSTLELGEAIEIQWDADEGGFLPNEDFTPPPRLDTRRKLLQCIPGMPISGKNVEKYEEHVQRACHLLSGAYKETFRSTGRATEKKKQRYGIHPYGDAMRLGGQLLEKAEAGVVVIETGHWDFHWDTEGRMPLPAEQLDQSVAALIAEYADRYTICVRGEFGRTAEPQFSKVNSHKPGRNHDHKHSGILAGPTIVPGVVYGRTSKCGFHLEDGVVTDEGFAYTLLEAGRALPRNSSGTTIQKIIKAA